MKTLKIVLFVSVVLAIVLISCGKDKSGTDLKKPDYAFMSSHRWKMISYTCNPAMKINNVMITDFLANTKPCKQDDIFVFLTDSTYCELEGLTKCDVTNKDTVYIAKYTLSKDQTSLVADDFPGQVQISVLDNNKMGWQEIITKDNVTYTVNYVFEGQ